MIAYIYSILSVLFWVTIIFIIIYLIIKRVNDKNLEDFENREN